MWKEHEITAVHDGLAHAPGLRRVGPGESVRFERWDLASIAENTLGESIEPDTLTASQERSVRRRLGDQAPFPHEDDHSTRYWLLDADQVVGTVAMTNTCVGVNALRIESLYVHPRARHRGHATAALDTLYRTVVAQGLGGVHLHTDWTWQPAVRFYLLRGWWVRSWKHDLGFCRRPGQPRHEVVHGRDRVEFLVEDEGRTAALLTARRNGVYLDLHESELHQRLRATVPRGRLLWEARQTFALHLALVGWPLVRGAEDWERALDSSDGGQSEGLAYKIRLFERAAQDAGRHVDTPPLVLDPALPPL